MFKKAVKRTKLRGHVSHGHGRVGKHRKSSGGAGKAGGLKHLKTLFSKYHPTHFGKTGMNDFHRKKNANFFKSIKTDELFQLVPKNERESFYEEIKNGKVPVFDCRKFGIAKVIGSGYSHKKIHTPEFLRKGAQERAVVVVARAFTENAKEEIQSFGGKCVISA